MGRHNKIFIQIWRNLNKYAVEIMGLQDKKQGNNELNKTMAVPFLFYCSKLWTPNKTSSTIQSAEMTFLETKGCTKLDHLRYQKRIPDIFHAL